MNKKWNDFKINKKEDSAALIDAALSREQEMDSLIQETRQIFEDAISENLAYHIKNKISISENIFRPSSKADLELINEARNLWKKGLYQPNEDEEDLFKSDIGLVGVYEGKKVLLDMPMLIKEKKVKEKKDPPLNKPKRNSGGKKYKVYVRDPKTKNIKKVTFGDSSGGLKGNWNDPEARASFAKRHKCSEKKDKTKAGYWACRAHKYFGKNVPGRFW